MPTEARLEKTDTPRKPIASLSLLLFFAAALVAVRLIEVLREPQAWIMVSQPWMGALGFQRFLHVVLGASQEIWIGFWAMLSVEMEALLMQSRKGKSYELDRISFLALWLAAYFGALLAASLLLSGLRPDLLTSNSPYPLAPIVTAAILLIRAASLGSMSKQKNREPSASRAVVLWAAACILIVSTRCYKSPGLLPSASLGLTALVLVAGAALAIALWRLKTRRVEESLRLFSQSRFCRPGLPALLLSSVLLAALLSGMRWSRENKGSTRERPNVILITVDTLRADHLGSYGYGFKTTPELDFFGEESSLFTECMSTAPYTAPSVWSMMTSKYPSTHLVGLPDGQKIIGNQPTLARALAKNGYRTVAFVSNFVLRRSRRFYQGFDIYDDTLTSSALIGGLPERTAEKTNQYVLNWLETADDMNFFLWVHYQDPHGPYRPPGGYLGRFPEDGYGTPEDLSVTNNDGRGGIPRYQYVSGQTAPSYYRHRYDGEIAYADEHVGRLLKRIKEMGLWDESIVILTADHGEAMGEHGYYFSHGHDLTEELIHVPLIMHVPRMEQIGRIDELVSIIDIVPTVLAAVGLEEEMESAGLNLAPLIEGKVKGLDRDHVVAEDLHQRVCFRTREFKYIDGPDGERIYDLSRDPDELINILEDQPELAVAWRKIRDDYRASAKPRTTIVPQYDPGDVEKLKALGYLD